METKALSFGGNYMTEKEVKFMSTTLGHSEEKHFTSENAVAPGGWCCSCCCWCNFNIYW